MIYHCAIFFTEKQCKMRIITLLMEEFCGIRNEKNSLLFGITFKISYFCMMYRNESEISIQ